jgi:hypothetical protein
MQYRAKLIHRTIVYSNTEYYKARARLDMRLEEWLVTTKEGQDVLLNFLEQMNAFQKVTRRSEEEERERFARRRGLAAWMIGDNGREALEGEGLVISGWDSEGEDQQEESGEEEDQGEAKALDRPLSAMDMSWLLEDD